MAFIKWRNRCDEVEVATHPNEYRACTNCLMPVSIPPIPMKAGGRHVSNAKKTITNEASLRLKPNSRVASMPVGILFKSQEQ